MSSMNPSMTPYNGASSPGPPLSPYNQQNITRSIQSQNPGVSMLPQHQVKASFRPPQRPNTSGIPPPILKQQRPALSNLLIPSNTTSKIFKLPNQPSSSRQTIKSQSPNLSGVQRPIMSQNLQQSFSQRPAQSFIPKSSMRPIPATMTSQLPSKQLGYSTAKSFYPSPGGSMIPKLQTQTSIRVFKKQPPPPMMMPHSQRIPGPSLSSLNNNITKGFLPKQSYTSNQHITNPIAPVISESETTSSKSELEDIESSKIPKMSQKKNYDQEIIQLQHVNNTVLSNDPNDELIVLSREESKKILNEVDDHLIRDIESVSTPEKKKPVNVEPMRHENVIEDVEPQSKLNLLPYSNKNLTDIWLPYVDQGVMFSAYYPPMNYPGSSRSVYSKTHRFKNLFGSRSIPSALTTLQSIGPDSLPSTKRAYYLPHPTCSLSSSNTPIHVRANVPSHPPPFAYQYDRVGVMNSSPPFASYPTKRGHHVQHRSCSPLMSSRKHKELTPVVGDDIYNMATVLRDDATLASQCFNEMQSVMTVQSYEIQMMVQAMQELKTTVAQQQLDLQRAEQRRKDIALEMSHIRQSKISGRGGLDAMLKKAERQLGAALVAGKKTGVIPQPLDRPNSSFFDNTEIPPASTHITTATIGIGECRKNGNDYSNHEPLNKLKKRKKIQRKNVLKNQSSDESSNLEDKSDYQEDMDELYNEKKIKTNRLSFNKNEIIPVPSTIENTGTSFVLSQRANTDPLHSQLFDSTLPPDLQKVLVRPVPDSTKKCSFIVIGGDNKDPSINQTFEVSDIRGLQNENTRLNEIIATLERRLSALYSELRFQHDISSNTREMKIRLEEMKYERDMAVADNINLKNTVDTLNRKVKSLELTVSDLQDSIAPNIPRMVSLSDTESLDSPKQSYSSNPTIITTLTGDDRKDESTPARYTYSRTLRRKSADPSGTEGDGLTGETKEQRKLKRSVQEKTSEKALTDKLFEERVVQEPSSIKKLIERKGGTLSPPSTQSQPTSSEPDNTSDSLSDIINELKLEQSKSSKLKKEIDEMTASREKEKLIIDAREDKLKTALQHQETLKKTETELLKNTLDNQLQLLTSIITKSPPDIPLLKKEMMISSSKIHKKLEDLSSRDSSPTKQPSSPTHSHKIEQKTLTEWKDDVKKTISESQTQHIQLMQQISEKTGEIQRLKEKLDQCKTYLKSEITLREKVESHLKDTQKSQTEKIQTQTESLYKAAQEIKLLRTQADKAKECIPLQNALDQSNMGRKQAENKIITLTEKLQEVITSSQSRIEEGKRTFEIVVAERDKLIQINEDLRKENHKIRAEYRSTTELLEKAERTIIDLSPETRDKFIELLGQRTQSSDAQIQTLRKQLTEMKKQKEETEQLRRHLKEDLIQVREKLSNLETMFTEVSSELDRKSELLGEERSQRLARERLFKETQLRNEFVEKCLTEHVETIRQKNEKIKDIMENREKFKEALAIVGENYKVLEDQLKHTEERLLAERATALELTESIQKAHELQAQLNIELDNLATENRDYSHKLGRADLILIRRGAELNETTKRLEKKVTDIQQLTIENEALKMQVQEQQDELQNKYHEANINDEKLSVSSRLQQLTYDKRQTLTEEINHTQLELTRTTHELEDARRDLDKLSVEKMQTESRCAFVEEELRDAKSECQQLANELKRVLNHRSELLRETDLLKQAERQLMKEAAASRERDRLTAGGLQEFESELTKTLAEKDILIEQLTAELHHREQENLEFTKISDSDNDATNAVQEFNTESDNDEIDNTDEDNANIISQNLPTVDKENETDVDQQVPLLKQKKNKQKFRKSSFVISSKNKPSMHKEKVYEQRSLTEHTAITKQPIPDTSFQEFQTQNKQEKTNYLPFAQPKHEETMVYSNPGLDTFLKKVATLVEKVAEGQLVQQELLTESMHKKNAQYLEKPNNKTNISETTETSAIPDAVNRLRQNGKGLPISRSVTEPMQNIDIMHKTEIQPELFPYPLYKSQLPFVSPPLSPIYNTIQPQPFYPFSSPIIPALRGGTMQQDTQLSPQKYKIQGRMKFLGRNECNIISTATRCGLLEATTSSETELCCNCCCEANACIPVCHNAK